MTTVLSGRRLNGKLWQLNPGASGSGSGSTGGTGGTGGTGTTTPPVTTPPSGPMSQSFTLANWGSATSAVLYRRGVWFKKGDVPAGQVPQISGGTMQLYAISRWSDGSMKRARMLLSDASLAAGATRTYTMTASAGALAGSTRTIGAAGLAAALSGHDFKVTFANVKDSAGAAYGGGALTASLATHAGTTTRWDLLSSSTVADVWQGWGMAASDPHLKVNWTVTRWKNADGSTRALQIAAEPTLDWWNVVGKSDLTYDTALVDGGTTIVSAAAVQHYYHTRWLLCVNDGSLNAGVVPFVGVTQPTLHYSYDKAYAVSTGLFPPYRQTKTPVVAPQFAYVPCNVVADPNTADHPNSHRTFIDAVGNYQGRGAMTRFDVDAFMAQTAQAATVSRLTALTALGVPYHYRSSRTRTRPGESVADVANTNIPLLLRPKPASASDFTAQGLPIAVDAYRGGSSGNDGFVQPALLSSNPWSISLEPSHGVSYCHYAALVFGDEHFTEAALDLAMNLAHQGIYGYHNYAQPFAHEYNPACPAEYWTGLLGQWHENNMRYVGWAQLIQGHGLAGLPADHQFAPCALATQGHNGDYIGTNLDYLPPDFAASGAYYPEAGLPSLFSPWMAGFGAIGAYAAFLCNEDLRWKRLGDHISTWTLKQAAAGRWYCWDIYRTANRTACAPWNATSNPELEPTLQGYLEVTANLTASSGIFTVASPVQFNVIGCSGPPPRNGDRVVFTKQTDGGSNGVLAQGVADGTVAYVINLNGGSGFPGRNPPATPPTFQVSASIGGPPMTFAADATGLNLSYCPQSVTEYPVASSGADYLSWPYVPGWDNYVPVHLSVVMMARQAGNPLATKAIRDGALAFVAAMDGNSSYVSNFDMATTT